MDAATNAIADYLHRNFDAYKVENLEGLPTDRAFSFVLIAHGSRAEATGGEHPLFRTGISSESFSTLEAIRDEICRNQDEEHHVHLYPCVCSNARCIANGLDKPPVYVVPNSFLNITAEDFIDTLTRTLKGEFKENKTNLFK